MMADRFRGTVLYQQQGDLDIDAMRRSILANLENNTYVSVTPHTGRPDRPA